MIPRKRSFAAEQLQLRKGKKKIMFWIMAGVLAALLAITGYIAYSRLGLKEKPGKAALREQEPIKSIAVLPFVDMSPEGNQEYFCNGIADEIINALTRIPDINVTARTSSFAFKGQSIDIRDIGRKLNVETVLEGSVRKADNRLRITTQFVKVDDGFHLWSETFDREFGDIFAIQEEISLAIVDALKGKVLESERASLEKRYTGDPEAYEQYLLAMNILKSWSDSTIRIEKINKKVYDHLHSAVEKDPDFALAYAGFAYYHIFTVWVGFASPSEAYGKARENIKKAIAIDSDLSEAHHMKAMIHTYYDWDWDAAEQSYKKALVLNPGNAMIHHQYAEFLVIRGRLQEALNETEQAYRLNPLDLDVHYNMMNINRKLGNYEEMKDFFQRGLAISPGFQLGYRVMGHYYLSRGDYHNALEQFLKIDEIVPGWIVTEAWIAHTCARLGEREKAEAILHRWLERSRTEFVPSLPIASIYIGLGEYDRAFDFLEKAYEERDGHMLAIVRWPDFDPVRQDPRFKALLKKMKLPED